MMEHTFVGRGPPHLAESWTSGRIPKKGHRCTFPTGSVVLLTRTWGDGIDCVFEGHIDIFYMFNDAVSMEFTNSQLSLDVAVQDSGRWVLPWWMLSKVYGVGWYGNTGDWVTNGTGGGNWVTPATWTAGSGYPNATDDNVEIVSGDTLTMDGSYATGNFIITNGTYNPANSSYILSPDGNVDFSGGSITNGSTNSWTLNTTGSSKTITTASFPNSHIYNWDIDGTISIATGNTLYLWNDLDVGASASLTITNQVMNYYWGGTFTYNGSGTIGGTNHFWLIPSIARNMPSGKGDFDALNVRFVGANATFTLKINISTTGDIYIHGGNNQISTLDCDSSGNYSIACGSLNVTRDTDADREGIIYFRGSTSHEIGSFISNTDNGNSAAYIGASTVECDGNADFSELTTLSEGTSTWVIIGSSRTVSLGASMKFYDFQVGDASTTTSVTAATIITADNYTITNVGTFALATYTHIIRSGWYVNNGGVITYNTSKLQCTGAGARDQYFQINDTDGQEYYQLDFDASYEIQGEVATHLVHSAVTSLDLAASVVLTLLNNLVLFDDSVLDITFGGGSSIVSSANWLVWAMDGDYDGGYLVPAAYDGPLDGCPVKMTIWSNSYTPSARPQVAFGTQGCQFGKLSVTVEAAYTGGYEMDFNLGDEDLIVDGACTIEAEGRMYNYTLDFSNATINGIFTINGYFLWAAFGGDSILTMAAGMNIVINSGATFIGQGFSIVNTAEFTAASGVLTVQVNGGDLTFDNTVFNPCNFQILSSCTIDADVWAVGNSGSVGLSVGSDFTLTQAVDCVFIGANFGMEFYHVSSPPTGDYTFTTCGFTGSLADIQHGGTGILELIDCNLTNTTVGINTVGSNDPGAVIHDRDVADNTVNIWGECAVTDATNYATWASDIDMTIRDDDEVSLGTTNHADITWDASTSLNSYTIEANSQITIGDGVTFGYDAAGTPVTNNGQILIDLTSGQTCRIQAEAGSATWNGNAPELTASCEGTFYLGTEAGYEGMDLSTNSIDFAIGGAGCIVQLDGTNNFYTINLGASDTLTTPQNATVANVQNSNALTIFGTLRIGWGTISFLHTWNMDDGSGIGISNNGSFTILGANGLETDLTWTSTNGGQVQVYNATLSWTYADVNNITRVYMRSGADITIDNSNLEVDTASDYGLYSDAPATITSMNTTTITGGGYAIWWSANGVDCTGVIVDCTLIGSVKDIYFNGTGSLLETLDSDDNGAGGEFEVEVPSGGVVQDMRTTYNQIIAKGTVSVSDLTNYGNWDSTDELNAGSSTYVVTLALDVAFTIERLIIFASCIVNCSSTITTTTAETTSNSGAFNCLDGMLFGAASGLHIWSGTAPLIGYDYLNKPTIKFKNMDFSTNNVAIDTTNTDVVLETSGNIYWYTLEVQKDDEWRHIDDGTTITWEDGQTSTIYDGGFARVYGSSGGGNVVWTTLSGGDHLFVMNGAYLFKWLTVDHSDASGGDQIMATDSTNGGDNTNWWFSGDTTWHGMSPEIFEVGATQLTPLILSDVNFRMRLRLYEYTFQRGVKCAVDQNIVDVRGRENMILSIECLDLTSGSTDLAQFEDWFREHNTISIIDRYSAQPINFYSYTPNGWRLTGISRTLEAGNNRVVYQLNFEEVPA